MGTKNLDYVGEWARWGLSIPVRCRRCGHKGEVRASSLILSHGWNREPDTLPFRCSVCGARGKRIAVGRAALLGL